MAALLKRLMDRYGAPDWRFAHRLWSVQAAVFWAAISMFWVVLPGFQAVLPPMTYAALCVIMCLLMAVARVTNQPSVPNG